ncbi:MAG: hypothetical protein JJT94_16970 [Bernardetiaceae bacterium]|nr:hypothetical protein [Bernardetiaceae bacterium]
MIRKLMFIALFICMFMFVFSSCRPVVVVDAPGNGKKRGWFKNGKAFGQHPGNQGRGRQKAVKPRPPGQQKQKGKRQNNNTGR